MIDPKLLNRFQVDSKKFRLKDHDPAWSGDKAMRELSGDEVKARAQGYIKELLDELSKEQERLWAQDQHSVLIVLQAMDAAGKDGLIKHVMSGINPQGCSVHSSRSHRRKSWITIFFGAAINGSRRGARSAFSTAPTTRRCWWCASTPSSWARRRLPGIKKVNGKFWERRYERHPRF